MLRALSGTSLVLKKVRGHHRKNREYVHTVSNSDSSHLGIKPYKDKVRLHPERKTLARRFAGGLLRTVHQGRGSRGRRTADFETRGPDRGKDMGKERNVFGAVLCEHMKLYLT